MEGRLLVLVTLAVVGLLVEHSPVIAQDDHCKEPFIWIKGCCNQPTREMITNNFTLQYNRPGKCLQMCGATTILVALLHDHCLCLKDESRPRVQLESVCNYQCPSDQNLVCGSKTGSRRRGWSLYQKALEDELVSMHIQLNATGCGFASSDGSLKYDVASCAERRTALCFNLMENNCLEERDSDWKNIYEYCGNMLLASSREMLENTCQVRSRLGSFWLGLYRKSESIEGCVTSTINEMHSSRQSATTAVQQSSATSTYMPVTTNIILINTRTSTESAVSTSTGISLELLAPISTSVMSEYLQSSEDMESSTKLSSNTNYDKVISFSVVEESPTSTVQHWESATKVFSSVNSVESSFSTEPVSPSSVFENSKHSKFLTNVHVESSVYALSTSIKSVIYDLYVPDKSMISPSFLTSETLNKASYMKGHSVENTLTWSGADLTSKPITHEVTHMNTAVLENTASLKVKTGIQESKATERPTISDFTTKIARHVELLISSSPTSGDVTVISEIKTSLTRQKLDSVAVVTSTISAITAKSEIKESSGFYTSAATSSIIQDWNGSSERIGNSGKETGRPPSDMIALYVIGSCIGLLLLITILMFCRISRELQKLSDRVQMINASSMSTFQTDGSEKYPSNLRSSKSSLPLRSGILSGRQRPPYPYSLFYGNEQDPSSNVNQLRERKSNYYKSWLNLENNTNPHALAEERLNGVDELEADADPLTLGTERLYDNDEWESSEDVTHYQDTGHLWKATMQ